MCKRKISSGTYQDIFLTRYSTQLFLWVFNGSKHLWNSSYNILRCSIVVYILLSSTIWFHMLIPPSFLLVKAPLKLIFWYTAKLHRYLYLRIVDVKVGFIVFHTLYSLGSLSCNCHVFPVSFVLFRQQDSESFPASISVFLISYLRSDWYRKYLYVPSVLCVTF